MLTVYVVVSKRGKVSESLLFATERQAKAWCSPDDGETVVSIQITDPRVKGLQRNPDVMV